MSYQSPLHILESLQISPNELTDESVNRLRKKYLAEFNLNPTTTIDINGKAYSKDEVLKTIDSLKEVDNLAGHQNIFEKKNLLAWLEKPLKSRFPNQEIKEIFDSNVNHDFYFPILINAFEEYVDHYIKCQQFRKIEEALVYIPNLGMERSSLIYESINTEIENVIELLVVAKKDLSPRANRLKFRFITEPEWTDLLNSLPDGFDEVRTNYCFHATNYTAAIHTLDLRWAYEISSQLVQTNCDPELKKSIDKNHSICSDNYFRSEENAGGGGGDTGGWGWIRIVLFLIIIVARMASCSH
jgi:hypothetical protein